MSHKCDMEQCSMCTHLDIHTERRSTCSILQHHESWFIIIQIRMKQMACYIPVFWGEMRQSLMNCFFTKTKLITNRLARVDWKLFCGLEIKSCVSVVLPSSVATARSSRILSFKMESSFVCGLFNLPKCVCKNIII